MFVKTIGLPYQQLVAGTRLKFVSRSGNWFIVEIVDDELNMKRGGARHIRVVEASVQDAAASTMLICVPLGVVSLNGPRQSVYKGTIATISPDDIVLLLDGSQDAPIPGIHIQEVSIDVPARETPAQTTPGSEG